MRVFLDTSSLVKLYHEELGTSELDMLFKLNTIETIFLSEISKLEFESAFWKKARTKEITHEKTQLTISYFRADYDNFSFTPLDGQLVNRAKNLMVEYWDLGLRTLDALQLASALNIKPQIDLALTADHRLLHIFDLEKVPTK